jgi:hypothetical protein
MPSDFGKVIDIIQAEKEQIKFLLSQAPMMDMVENHCYAGRTPFAYVHPKTISKASHDAACVLAHGRQVVMFPGSPTQWITTPLMTEGCVIFTPNRIPGIEKILAR